MDKSWLHVFKLDVYSQSGQIQKALFEQFLQTIGELECMRRLEETSRRRAVSSAFLKAIQSRYTGMNEELIAEKLRESAACAAENRMLSSSPLPAILSLRPDELEAAWSEVSFRIRAVQRRRKRIQQFGSTAFLALIVLLGGLLFGTAPIQVATSAQESSFKKPPLPDGYIIPMTELKLTEKEAVLYADFKMTIPSYLPPGYKLEEAVVWLREGETKSDHTLLVYTNDQKHLLRVSFYKLHKNGVFSTGVNLPESTTEVYIRGNKGLLVTTRSRFATLNWLEHDVYINISGRELDAEELVKIADSLK